MEESMENKANHLKHRLGILKARHNGAIRIKPPDRGLLSELSAFKQEFGLSANKLAAMLEVAPYQMCYLLARARKKPKAPKPTSVKFKEVQVETQSSVPVGIELVLPSGIRVSFPCVKDSAEFIRLI